MPDGKLDLLELQEILLWQKLNKQLLAVSKKGRDIEDHHHDYLQSFCFDNNLFLKTTSAQILDEAPLAIISDLKEKTFITSKTPQWTNLLSSIMPSVIRFDLEKALGEAFDTLSVYKRKYGVTGDRKNGESDDDQELFTFINSYLDLRELRIKEFSSIIKTSHKHKGTALKEIVEIANGKSRLKLVNNRLILDFGDLARNGKLENVYDKANHIYIETYCEKVLQYLRKGSRVGQTVKVKNVHSFLEDKLHEKGFKKSIEAFIRFELNLLQTETALTDKYINDLQNRITTGKMPVLPICDVSPFIFLTNPLPLV